MSGAAGKLTNQPAKHEHHSTTSKEHDCAGALDMAAGIADFGDFGARGCYRDRGCYRRNPISRRLRLPHPATAMDLLSAADLGLAELCSHLRRGLSSIQTRGDAAGLDARAGR